jgi:hypothetical protein
LTLNYFFDWGSERDKFPISYGMFSKEGDRAVGIIIEEFITAINNNPDFSTIPLGQVRLNLLQNCNIKTSKECLYDEFIGHRDNPLPPDSLPKDLFEKGEY